MNNKITVLILRGSFAQLFRNITYDDDNLLYETIVASNCFASREKRAVRQELLEQVRLEVECISVYFDGEEKQSISSACRHSWL